MKICPKNNEHLLFITVAHISEFWIVDGDGNFEEIDSPGEIVAKPDPLNSWTCVECGTEAIEK